MDMSVVDAVKRVRPKVPSVDATFILIKRFGQAISRSNALRTLIQASIRNQLAVTSATAAVPKRST